MRQNNNWRNYEYDECEETFEKFRNTAKGPRRKDKREVERRKEKQSKAKNQK